MQVDVCIATCERPEMLALTLAGVRAQRVDPDVEIRVIVVDNDHEGSARLTADAARAAGLDVVYAVEPERNIAAARNRAVGMATGDFVAMVDDDEQPEPGWLADLLRAATRYGADVVFGPVERLLPTETPSYLRDSGAFELPNPAEGASTGIVFNTGNCLVRRAALGGEPFDRGFGQTGGEDTKLFHRLEQGGAKIVWARGALVRETVPAARARLGWVLARSFREGAIVRRVEGRWYLAPEKPLAVRFFLLGVWSAKSLVLAALEWVAPRLRSAAVARLRVLFFNWGIAAQELGVSYRPYRRTS